MDPRDLARYALLTVIFGGIAIFGLNTWNKHKAENALVSEIRALTADASMFEQFNKQDAGSTLLRILHKLHLADTRFGLSADAALDRSFKIKEDGILDSTDSTHQRESPRQRLIRESLLRNLENAERLGFFSDSLSIDLLARGDTPTISAGPSSGRSAELAFLIDPSAFQGSERLIPNLVIRPPENENSPPDDFEIAQAKSLAGLLHDCGLIERDARDRIIAHYDSLGKEEEIPD